ncbi:MAG TPA: tetratricopeptide repeat protein [Acidimicrobiales bacterium]|nr:tetratricopeptide repeat protein [Acidimicrobiales bacterium]
MARRAVARGRSVGNAAPAGDRVPDEAARRFRGSVARKGARVVASPDQRPRNEVARGHAEREEWEPEVWVEDVHVTADDRAAGHAPRRTRPERSVPEHVKTELQDAVGATKVGNVERRMAEAVKAYERDRYQDALTTLRPVARVAPMSPAVRELHGLTLYRLGKWTAAIRELEAFHALTGSYDQHPVLADCYRAKGRMGRVEELFEELRKSSPSPDVLTEGRIVTAMARADRGDLAGAVELLERARTKVRSPQLHHLRLWYALADLYERAGELPRARALFASVLDHDPTLFDTAERVTGLA